MTNALVTGATGFIGYHMVKQLSARGINVTCLVRPTSDRRWLEELRPRFLEGDVTDRDSVRAALVSSQIDVVYHLAGLTKSLHAADLSKVNEAGTRHVAACCADLDQPPVLVVVSSLSAAGPAKHGRMRTETDQPSPVSRYGRSKRAGELAAIEYADRVPITIVRPPIVLGEADQDGFHLFRGIARLGLHVVPTLHDHDYSVIHAEDLAAGCLLAAQSGQRVCRADAAQGIYFAAAAETVTYAGLGRLIGQVLGRNHTFVVRMPGPCVYGVATVTELASRLRGRPHILSTDKAREAMAGSWACSSEKLHSETGFVPGKSLRQRLEQTAGWYFDQGWLNTRSFLHTGDYVFKSSPR
jgi:nucleoside-diphosphate-sugar epimerase